jgi:hypothetical protein
MGRAFAILCSLIIAMTLAASARADVVVTRLVTSPLLRASNGITTDGTNLYVTTSASFPVGSVVSAPLAGGSATQVYTYSGQPQQGTASGLGITTLGSKASRVIYRSKLGLTSMLGTGHDSPHEGPTDRSMD